MYSYNQADIKERIVKIKHSFVEEGILYFVSGMWRENGVKAFTYNNKEYRYAYLKKNSVYLSERAIEIPIIMQYVDECISNNGKILEVGNVLSYHFDFNRDIVDKYEKGDNVINEDIIDFTSSHKYDLIVAISTIEHIGFDEVAKDNDKSIAAIEHMKSLTLHGGKIVMTIPLGHNPYLEEHIREGKIQTSEMHLMKRIEPGNTWVEESIELFKSDVINYKSPYNFSATWILVMIVNV